MNYSKQKDYILERSNKLIRLNILLSFTLLLLTISALIVGFSFDFLAFKTADIIFATFFMIFLIGENLIMYRYFSVQIEKDTNKKLEALKQQRDAEALITFS